MSKNVIETAELIPLYREWRSVVEEGVDTVDLVQATICLLAKHETAIRAEMTKRK